MRIASSLLCAALVAASAVSRASAQERDDDHGRREGRHTPVLASVTTPFVAESDGARDRAFSATIVTKPARVPGEWPLVIQASIMIDGDPVKGTLQGVSCAPAIDGQPGPLTPLPQPPDPPGPPSSGDRAGETRGLFPDLHWGGAFAAGPLPRGSHTFTLVCVGAAPFELRGIVTLRVLGNPSGH